MYPNLYVFLVGPPGVGKGLIIDEVNRLLLTISGPTDLHIAPTSVTTSSMIDELLGAKRKLLRPTEQPPYIEFHSLQIVVPEFSDFAPMYDTRFMSALQSFYDCSEVPFGERRRSKESNIKIVNPQMGMIAGTTPSYLNSFMPETAWDQGFISRSIMVYAGDSVTPDIFAEDRGRDSQLLELKADLRMMYSLYGKLAWSPEAATMIQGWINDNQPPVPEHRKLMHYASRRIGHIIKLCMVTSVADSNELIIEAKHVEQAFSWLFEVEALMPEIFKATSSGGDSAAYDDCWFFMYKAFIKTGEPILESQIIEFLRDRMPSYSIMVALEIMQKSMMIERVDTGGPGAMFRYKPLPKTKHSIGRIGQ